MDMCDNYTDYQQWLLDNNDGSQVICTFQIENSQEKDMQHDDDIAATTDEVFIQLH